MGGGVDVGVVVGVCVCESERERETLDRTEKSMIYCLINRRLLLL